MAQPKYNAHVVLLKKPDPPAERAHVLHPKPEYDQATMDVMLQFHEQGYTRDSITEAFGFPKSTWNKWMTIHNQKEVEAEAEVAEAEVSEPAEAEEDAPAEPEQSDTE